MRLPSPIGIGARVTTHPGISNTGTERAWTSSNPPHARHGLLAAQVQRCGTLPPARVIGNPRQAGAPTGYRGRAAVRTSTFLRIIRLSTERRTTETRANGCRDARQWLFYVVATSALPKTKSLSEAGAARLADPVTFEELATRVEALRISVQTKGQQATPAFTRESWVMNSAPDRRSSSPRHASGDPRRGSLSLEKLPFTRRGGSRRSEPVSWSLARVWRPGPAGARGGPCRPA